MAQIEITVCDYCSDHIDWENGEDICGPIEKDYCCNLCFTNDLPDVPKG